MGLVMTTLISSRGKVGKWPCPRPSLYEKKMDVAMVILILLAMTSALPFLAQLPEARWTGVHSLCPSLDDQVDGVWPWSLHPFPSGMWGSGHAPRPTLLEAWLSVAMVIGTPWS